LSRNNRSDHIYPAKNSAKSLFRNNYIGAFASADGAPSADIVTPADGVLSAGVVTPAKAF
jgi:hypothetical protein